MFFDSNLSFNNNQIGLWFGSMLHFACPLSQHFNDHTTKMILLLLLIDDDLRDMLKISFSKFHTKEAIPHDACPTISRTKKIRLNEKTRQ